MHPLLERGACHCGAADDGAGPPEGRSLPCEQHAPGSWLLANQNPIEELLERLRAQFGQAPGPSVEAMVRRFFEPFALVPKADFEQQQAALAEAEATITALDARVTALEAKAAKAAKKRKKKSTAAKKVKPKD